MKRLIGLAGDDVLGNDLHIHKVPEGKCWIEGDNRSNSRDSNEYGPVRIKSQLAHHDFLFSLSIKL